MYNWEVKAKSLCKASGGTLRIISFVAALLNFAVVTVVRLLDESADMYVLSQIVSFICGVLLYPIVTLGAAYVYLETWRGNTPSFSMLWRFVSSKNGFINALKLGLLYQLFAWIFLLSQYLSLLLTGYLVAQLLFMLVLLIEAAIYIWLLFRFVLVPYLFSASPAEKTTSYFRESFRRMKGNCGRLIGLGISTTWWRYLILLVPALVLVSALRLDRSYLSVYTSMFGLLLSLLLPYPLLVLAGFANDLIDDSTAEEHLRFAEEEALTTKEFHPIRGVTIADLTGIHESYEIENENNYFTFTANVSAEKIIPMARSFCEQLEEPCFFILEVPTNEADERELRQADTDPLHSDVYYCDGMTRQGLLELLDEYGELLINDGMSNFGMASHTSNDELFFSKYKIAKLYTANCERYREFMRNIEIPYRTKIKTVWENFTHEDPGMLSTISVDGKNVFGIMDDLKERGFYFAKRREG